MFRRKRFAAMADAEDPHDIVLEQEQDAVVAQTEAKSPSHFAMQWFECRQCPCRSSEGLSWRDDASNLDTAFTRYRIRLETLPALSQTYNPNLETLLARSADSLPNFQQIGYL